MHTPKAEHKHAILIVEDDYSIRETMKGALNAKGYKVETAENGMRGLKKLREMVEPCIVLLDMAMPVLDGRGFLDAIAADSKLSKVPVLVVSATATEVNAKGAKAIIVKPIDLNELFKLIRRTERAATQ